MVEDPGLFDAAFFNYSAETASVRRPRWHVNVFCSRADASDKTV